MFTISRIQNDFSRTNFCRALALGSLVFLVAPANVMPVLAGDALPSVDATYKDIEKTLGKVPDFLKVVSKAALPGAWQEAKAVTFSDNSALPPKVKSLISLAVAAQIPCSYCIWSDTQDAKRAGATDDEIQEAVAVAAITRHWSTIFNGMQVDLDTFKKDLGGDAK